MRIKEVSGRLDKVTVHGRFQPPLHINHWQYISQAFDIADKVIVLIANPYLTETSVGEAAHRNLPENNPFTYDQRIQIFAYFFAEIGIDSRRYEFKPFDIVNESTWSVILDPKVSNLINTYGPWSEKKLQKFVNNGFSVIHSSLPKSTPVSGSDIRRVLKSDLPQSAKQTELIRLGYMKEAIPGLQKVLNSYFEC